MQYKTYGKHLQVKIPDELDQAVTRAAAAHFLSKPDFIRAALGFAALNGIYPRPQQVQAQQVQAVNR